MQSFSSRVRRREPTCACRRGGGCPLIISDQFVESAATKLVRRDPKIHKQSLGHPWPSSDLSRRFGPRLSTLLGFPENVIYAAQECGSDFSLIASQSRKVEREGRNKLKVYLEALAL